MIKQYKAHHQSQLLRRKNNQANVKSNSSTTALLKLIEYKL